MRNNVANRFIQLVNRFDVRTIQIQIQIHVRIKIMLDQS